MVVNDYPKGFKIKDRVFYIVCDELKHFGNFRVFLNSKIFNFKC